MALIFDLIRARSRPEVVSRMLVALGRPDLIGLPVNDWHSGGVTRTLMEISGEAIADTERTVEALGAGGYLDTAAGDWLDLLVESHYDMSRKSSSFARGTVTLTCAPTSGPYTLPAGLILQSESGVNYQTVEGGTLYAGGTLTLAIRAEEAGSAANVPTGTITRMLSPLPGVSVINKTGWLTQAGADQESDAALRTRARLQWPTLGGGMTRAAYEYVALSASASVTQVEVLDQHPRGQGTLDVILWGDGGLGQSAVDEVNAAIQERRPLTADVLVYSAAPREIYVTITLYAPALPVSERPRVEQEIQAGLATLQRETRIGGTLYRSQIIEVAMLPGGVLDATLQDGAQDIRLEQIEGLVLHPRIEWRSRP